MSNTENKQAAINIISNIKHVWVRGVMTDGLCEVEIAPDITILVSCDEPKEEDIDDCDVCITSAYRTDLLHDLEQVWEEHGDIAIYIEQISDDVIIIG